MNEAKYAAELTRRAEIIRRVVKKNPKEVTDRAHRYRAQENIKSDKKQCAWCGKKNLKGRDAMVAHKDGDESNDNPKNLAWTCRSCNALEANRQKRLGKGRRTRQFNPTTKNKKKHGCTSLAQWSAMMNIVGVKQGGVRYPAGVRTCET